MALKVNRFRIGAGSNGSEEDPEFIVNQLKKKYNALGYDFIPMDEDKSPFKKEERFERVQVIFPGHSSPTMYMDVRTGKVAKLGSAIELAGKTTASFAVISGAVFDGVPQAPIDNLGNIIEETYDVSTRTGEPPQKVFQGILQRGEKSHNISPIAGWVRPSYPDQRVGRMEDRVAVIWTDQTKRSYNANETNQKLWEAQAARGQIDYLRGYYPDPRQPGIWYPSPGARYGWEEDYGGGIQSIYVQKTKGDSQTKGPSLPGLREEAMDTFYETKDSAGRSIYRRLVPTRLGVVAGRTETPKGPVQMNLRMPGETAPRMVVAQDVLVTELPGYSGAALTSPTAFSVNIDGKNVPIAAAGERQEAKAIIPIHNIRELQEVIRQEELRVQAPKADRGDFPHGLAIFGRSGQVVSGGRGNATVGIVNIGGESRDIAIDKRAYPRRLDKPTIYIPAFYDESTGEFTNIGSTGTEGALMSTAPLIARLRKVVGKNVEIRSGSASGINTPSGDPADVYMVMGVSNIGEVSSKNAIKAGFVPTGPLSVRAGGRHRRVDIATGDLKIGPDWMFKTLGIMEPSVQEDFIMQFAGTTPDDKQRAEATVKWMRETRNADRSNNGLDIEELADVFNNAPVGKENKPQPKDVWSPEIFLTRMAWSLVHSDPSLQHQIYNKYKIAITGDQDMRIAKLSKEEMVSTLRLAAEEYYGMALDSGDPVKIAEADKIGREIAQGKRFDIPGLISFEKAKTKPGQRETWVESFHIAPQHAMLSRSGVSLNPEYSSQKGEINPIGQMDMFSQYPNIASSVGIASTYMREDGKMVIAMAGPNPRNNPSVPRDPKKEANAELFTWASSSELIRAGIPDMPANTIKMTPALAEKLKYAVSKAMEAGDDREVLNELDNQLRELDGQWEELGIPEGTRLRDTYIMDGLANLLPTFKTIKDAEFYGLGREQSLSQNYYGNSYLKMLQSSIALTLDNMGGEEMQRISAPFDRFFTKIRSKFYEESKQRKYGHMLSTATNIVLAGSGGYRYGQQLGAKPDEVFMTERELRQLVRSGGWLKTRDKESYKEKEDSLVNQLLNGGEDDSLIPGIFNRSPNISIKGNAIPVKVRLSGWAKKQGLPATGEGRVGGSSPLAISETIDRMSGGDQDKDYGALTLLPMTDEVDGQPGVKGKWHPVNKKAQVEWMEGVAGVNEKGARSLLDQMFGEAGTGIIRKQTNPKSFDVQRQFIREYMESIFSKNYLINKVFSADKVGPQENAEFLDTVLNQNRSQRGMAAAYSARTLVDEIVPYALGFDSSENFESEGVRQAAYERGAFYYQAYLDKWKEMYGGLSPAETILKTIHLGNKGLKLAATRQGQPHKRADEFIGARNDKGFDDVVFDKDGVWNPNSRDPKQAIRGIINKIVNDPKMSDEQVAWGFASLGKAHIVLDKLQKRGKRTREDILGELTHGDDDLVGFSSPFYAAAIYTAVSRFKRKTPEEVDNPNAQLPWVNGKIMTIQDIIASDEYQRMDQASALLIRKNTLLSTGTLENLVSWGTNNRVGQFLLGMYRDRVERTGGVHPLPEAQEELDKIVEARIQTLTKGMLSGTPVVHASELGGLTNRITAPGFNQVPDWIVKSTQLKVASEFFGAPDIFGTRDSKFVPVFKDPNANFLETEDIDSMSGMQHGTVFEDAAAEDPRMAGLTHIGKVKQPAGIPLTRGLFPTGNITFDVEGLTITGVPDFVGLSKDGKFIIRDTKLAKTQDAVEKRVKSSKNAIQQIGYAYGLEQIAKLDDTTQWNQMLSAWGIKDENEREKMRLAAANGRFDIGLTPGHIKQTGTQHETKFFDDVPIPYDEEMKDMYRATAALVRGKSRDPKYRGLFAPENLIKIASNLLGVLNNPAGMIEDLNLIRTGIKPMKKTMQILKNLASVRLAGGGSITEEGTHIRVGEGGPEDIVVNKHGIHVVPDHYGYRPGFGPPKFRLDQGEYDAAIAQGVTDPAILDMIKNHVYDSSNLPKTPDKMLVYTPEEIEQQQLAGDELLARRNGRGPVLDNGLIVRPEGVSSNTASISSAGVIPPIIQNSTPNNPGVPPPVPPGAGGPPGGNLPPGGPPFNPNRNSYGQGSRPPVPPNLQKVATNLQKYGQKALQFFKYRREFENSASALIKERATDMGINTYGITGVNNLLGLMTEDQKEDIFKYVAGHEDRLPMPLSDMRENQAAIGQLSSLRGATIKNPELLQMPGMAPVAKMLRLSENDKDFGSSLNPLLSGTGAIDTNKALVDLNDIAVKLSASFKANVDVNKELTKTFDVLNKTTKLNPEYKEQVREGLADLHTNWQAQNKLAGPLFQNGRVISLKEASDQGLSVTEENIKAARESRKIGAEIGRVSTSVQEAAGNKAGPMSDLARNFLGGWGMMYVGTLAGMGTAEYAKGYQQNIQAEDIATRVEAQYSGVPGQEVFNRRTQTAYESAIARSGNIPYKNWQKITTGMVGLEDISGAVQKGVGLSALSLFASKQIQETVLSNKERYQGGSLDKFGGLLSSASPYLLPVGIAAGLAFNQISYMQNPKETGLSMAGPYLQMSRDIDQNTKNALAPGGNLAQGLLSNVGAFAKTYYPNIGRMIGDWSTKLDLNDPEQASLIASARKEGYGTNGAPVTYGQAYSSVGAQILKGEKIDRRNLSAGIYSIASLDELGPYSEQAKNMALRLQFEATGGVTNLGAAKDIMGAIDSGIDVVGFSQKMSAMAGRGMPSSENINDIAMKAFSGKNAMSVEQINNLTAVADFVQNLPDDMAKLNGSKDILADLNKEMEKYGKVVGTSMAAPVAQALSAGQNLRAMGGDATELMGMANNVINTGQLSVADQQRMQVATNVAQGKMNWSNQLSAQLGMTGTGASEALATASRFMGSAADRNIASGIANYDSNYYTLAASKGVNLQGFAAKNINGEWTSMNDLALGDIDANGRNTGMSLFSSSLRQGSLSAEQTAFKMFGAGWEGKDKFGFRATLMNQGTRGLQQLYQGFQNDYQDQMQAIQQQQFAMSAAFQTGVGLNQYAGVINPQTGQAFNFNTGSFNVNVPGAGSFTSTGGGMWGLEDAQRALSNMQAQWQFGMQDKQLALQGSQFMENTSLNRKGQMMSRAWTEQQWAYDTQTRNLQWGWKQEDYQENARFLTGRERKQAEKQMGRETIMFGLEGEQLDKQKQQQKETWRLEDQQYKLQIKHFHESEALQKEQNKMSREFYEQNQQLQTQATALNRAYWVAQQDLQRRSMALTAEQNERQKDYNETMLGTNQYVDMLAGNAKLLQEAAPDVTALLNAVANLLRSAAPGGDSSSSGGSASSSNDINQSNGNGMALGGRVLKGQRATIGDTNETEFIAGDESATIIPISGLNPWASTMIASETGSNKPGAGGAKSHVHVYIGNRYLTDFVVDTLDKEVHL
jgi:hypothetical protein